MCRLRSVVMGTITAASASKRLFAIDAARGLALIGMIIVNVGPVANESVFQRLWFLPYGRASVLFVLIAGVSMSLFLRADHGRRRIIVVLWRAAILIVGGLLLGLLPHGVNVILPLYGGLFLVALLLYRLPTSVLIGLITVFMIVGPLIFVGESLDHTGEPRPELAWSGDIPGLLHTLFLSRPYPLVVWIIPFVFGMMLGRMDLRERRGQKAMIITGGIAGVGALAAAELFPLLLGEPERGYGLLLTGVPHGQMPLWVISSVGSAIFVTGLLLRFWSHLSRFATPVVLAGQMALTFYVGHLFLLAALRPEDGFTFLQGVGVSLLAIGGCILGALLWMRHFRTGPLEWAIRGRWLELRPGASP